MPEETTLTIIVVAYNTWDCLRDAIAHILANTARDFQLVVVDNGSTIPLSNLLKRYLKQVEGRSRRLQDYKIVRLEDNVGIAAGKNRGLALADGDLIAIVDSDVFVQVGWDIALVDTLLSEPQAGIVGSKVLYYHRPFPHRFGTINHGPYYCYLDGNEDVQVKCYIKGLRNGEDGMPQIRRCDVLAGACVLTRRDLIKAGLSFDEHWFFGYEDFDFSLQFLKQGLEALFCPFSVVYHEEGRTVGQVSQDYYDTMSAGQKHYAAKWHDLVADLEKRRPRLEIGSGEAPVPGLIHLDARQVAEVDVVGDAGRIPFRNDSLWEIYASHVLEHLPRREVTSALSEWFRVMKPGGYMLILCPDILGAFHRYCHGQIPFEDMIYEVYGLQRNAQDFHCAGFDYLHLSSLMEQAGFVNTRELQGDPPYWVRIGAEKPLDDKNTDCQQLNDRAPLRSGLTEARRLKDC